MAPQERGPPIPGQAQTQARRDRLSLSPWPPSISYPQSGVWSLGSWLDPVNPLFTFRPHPFTFLQVVLGDGLKLLATRQEHFLHAAEPLQMAFGIFIAPEEGMVSRIDGQLKSPLINQVLP